MSETSGVESQFKAICKLNRLLFLALVVVSVTQAVVHPRLDHTLFVSLLAVWHIGFLMGNEFLMRLLKRLRDATIQTVDHVSLLVPLAVALYVGGVYLLTGYFAALLLSLFGILESQYLGQPKLSKILTGFVILLFIAGHFLGYLNHLSLASHELFTGLAAWGVCIYYYGTMVSRLVRSHTNQVGKLQSMAATDVLTGLTNRRLFNTRLQEEVARARRHETPVSLALFDLDDFKRLNDFYGHTIGDRILKELGLLIRQNIRESDLPARYGGEEFALILPETREAEATELLERLCVLVAQTVFCLPENPLTLTISVGVAQLEHRNYTAFELVELADKALYEAKKQGKNQVVKASSLMARVLLK